MSETESPRNTESCGPACEGDVLIVEILGKDHPSGQELRLLQHQESTPYQTIDDQLEHEVLDSSVLRVWPWDEAPQADVALEIAAEQGDSLRIPLYTLPEVTPRQFVRQKLILAPLVPLTLVEREEPIAGVPGQQIVSARSGYLYLFRNNRLWREIRLSRDEDGRLWFRDVPVSAYRSEVQQRLSANKRLPTSVPLEEIWVPVNYYTTSATYVSDVRVAWSEVQWSAARIEFLENDSEAFSERTQRIVQRPDARWHRRFAELVALDEVAPQRGRQPLLEEQVPSTFDFLTDLEGSYGLACYELAAEEQENFFAGGENAESAWRESQYRNTDLGPTAAIRNMVLQDLANEAQEDAAAGESSRLVWENIGKSGDIFESGRKRGLMGIVVYDELFEIRKAMARTSSGILYQKSIREWASRQPHYQSAELVEQTVLPENLGGQPNPLNKHARHLDLSLTGKLEKALHRAYRAHGMNTIKSAQKRLLALLKDGENQARLADLFSLEGGDYQSGFLLSGQLFSVLQYDSESADKPWLAGTNPDCSTRCTGTLTEPDDTPARQGSELILEIAREGSVHPLHAMLYPQSEAVPLSEPYERPESEPNPGDGRFRPSAFAQLDVEESLPAQEDLQTIEAASLVALADHGAFNTVGFLRMTTKALDGISGQLMGQFNKALQSVYGELVRIDLDIHGPMVRALKAMNPTLLGELLFLPQGSQGMNMVLLGVEDPEIGLRNGLTDAERDYFNRNNHSGRFHGEIQDADGRTIGSTNPNRVPGGVNGDESGRFYAFMAPAKSDLVKNYRDVRAQISQQRSLGKALDRLGLPYVVLGFELWNLNNEWSRFSELSRTRGAARSVAGFASAGGDLIMASMAVSEQLTKKIVGSELVSRTMNYVVFDVQNAAATGRLLPSLARVLPSAITIRLVSVSILSVLDAGIRAADSIHYLRTGQTASALAMGSATAGALMSGWASISLMGAAKAGGAGAVLGLSTPVGWIVLGVGLTLVATGSVAASLLEDDELEAWLKNGPFGEYRNSTYEHLWGEAPEIDDLVVDEGASQESSSSFWSRLPWVENTPENTTLKPVPEREAFYRLANILAGVHIVESLHNVDSAEARRLAEANLDSDGTTPSRGEVDALHDELVKANFRVVVRSNLLGILGDAALKVHIRRFKEVHRPNPGSGGTTVVKTELQDSPDGDWWIHRRFLPDGIEYWLETPRPAGLEFHEWKIRARMVADLGSDREYVFPAPLISDPLVYEETRHGNHEAPDFTSDNTPFWACLTTDRRALNIRAHCQRNTVEESSDV